MQWMESVGRMRTSAKSIYIMSLGLWPALTDTLPFEWVLLYSSFLEVYAEMANGSVNPVVRKMRLKESFLANRFLANRDIV